MKHYQNILCRICVGSISKQFRTPWTKASEPHAPGTESEGKTWSLPKHIKNHCTDNNPCHRPHPPVLQAGGVRSKHLSAIFMTELKITPGWRKHPSFQIVNSEEFSPPGPLSRKCTSFKQIRKKKKNGPQIHLDILYLIKPCLNVA